jgi:hypothetical protein
MIRWVNRAPCSLKCSRKWRLNRASIHPRYRGTRVYKQVDFLAPFGENKLEPASIHSPKVPWVIYKLVDFLAHLERINKKKPTHFCCRFIGSKPPTSDSLYEGVL